MYSFNSKNYSSFPELVNAMAVYWEEGKEFLSGGAFRSQIPASEKSLYNSILYQEKKFHETPGKENLLFLKWILNTGILKDLYWLGNDYGDLNHLCQGMKSGLDPNTRKLLLLMIQEQIFSTYVSNSVKNDTIVSNVKYLERCYNRQEYGFSKKDIFLLLYKVLKPSGEFSYDGHCFKSVYELSCYLQGIADHSKGELSAKAAAFFQDDSNLTPDFESWLLTQGFGKELTSWREHFQSGEGNTSSAEDFVHLEDLEKASFQQTDQSPDSEEETAAFCESFTKMLEDHPESLQNADIFYGFMKDCFPDKDLLTFLLHTLYKMDILKAIQDANELTELFASRFIRRLEKDFGVQRSLAVQAMYIWCVCYGEKILQKKNFVKMQAAAG